MFVCGPVFGESPFCLSDVFEESEDVAVIFDGEELVALMVVLVFHVVLLFQISNSFPHIQDVVCAANVFSADLGTASVSFDDFDDEFNVFQADVGS